jgi:hypothetical protein
MISLPALSRTATGDRCPVNVHADILFLTHKGAPFR